MKIDVTLSKYKYYIMKRKYIFCIRLSELRLLKLFELYARLIIFTEQVGLYASRMILWSIIFTFMTSQFTIYSIKEIKRDKISVGIILYYLLITEHVIIILISYTISLYNTRLNSIHTNIRHTLIQTNQTSNKYFKFKMMIINQNMINTKPFGFKIGPINVLTKIIFAKVNKKLHSFFIII